MARLDVYQLAGGAGSTHVLDVQADLLGTLATRAVVPLIPETGFVPVLRELNPVFVLDGERIVMVSQAIATVPTSSVGRWPRSFSTTTPWSGRWTFCSWASDMPPSRAARP